MAVTFAVTNGSLPAGLTLSSGGVLSGTPTGLGPVTFTVTATDANSCTGSIVYTLTIVCPTSACFTGASPQMGGPWPGRSTAGESAAICRSALAQSAG